MLSWLAKGGALLLACLPLLIMVQHRLNNPCDSWQPCKTIDSPSPKNTDKLAKTYLASGLADWEQQHYQAALQQFELAAEAGSEPARLYQHYLADWLNAQQKTSGLVNVGQHWAAPDCLQQILFVTSELRSLPQAAEFIVRFKQDTRLQGLAICIAPQVVFLPGLLPCQNVEQDTRLSCDIGPLGAALQGSQFTHLVLFAKQGKANVHNGIMYLDQQDSYDVFVHELAHFSGFIDEYPLSASLAKRVCAGLSAPNLVFQQAGQSQPDMAYWQALGRVSGNNLSKLSKAKTCNNHQAQAFKASQEMTFMEYYDVRLIPASYLAAWQAALQHNTNITPAFINFAQLYEEQQDNAAHYWRERYQGFHLPQ